MSMVRSLLRFSAVGIVGFLLDAGVLTYLTSHWGWEPWIARVPSFATAVCATWLLNRRYSFAVNTPRSWSEGTKYSAIQVIGALINFVIFVLLIAHSSLLRNTLIVALAIGACGGLAFNFLATYLWLYRAAR